MTLKNIFSSLISKYLPCLFTIGFLISSCKKADNYYKELDGIPQVAGVDYAYRNNYKVGDTILFYGRFGSTNSDLKIHIGNTDAAILNRTNVEVIPAGFYSKDINFSGQLQMVKSVITEQMGIGPDRPVQFTVGGQTIKGPAIYIRDFASASFFTDTLQIVPAGFDYDGTTNYTVKSNNGTGRVFYIDYTKSSVNVWYKGKVTEIFSGFADANGTFKVSEVTAATVDPQENNLYFYAITKDAPANDTLVVTRFCKVDLHTHQLTTLKRSVNFSNIKYAKVADFKGPFEGSIAQVQLPRFSYLSAGSDGTVYFTANNMNYSEYTFTTTTAVGKIDASNRISYLNGSLLLYYTELVSYVQDDGTIEYYDNEVNTPLLVKNNISFSNPTDGYGFMNDKLQIDAESGRLFFLALVSASGFQEHYRINVFGLKEQRELFSFAPEQATISVPLVLDGPLKAVKYDQNGTWFLQKGKPVFFLSVNNSFNLSQAAVSIDLDKGQTAAYTPFYTYPAGQIWNYKVMNYTPEGQVIFARQYDLNEESSKYPGFTIDTTAIKK